MKSNIFPPIGILPFQSSLLSQWSELRMPSDSVLQMSPLREGLPEIQVWKGNTEMCKMCQGMCVCMENKKLKNE